MRSKAYPSKRKKPKPLDEVLHLFEAVEERGLSVHEFAKLCKVNHSTMSRWRSGETMPTLAVFLHCKKIVDAMP
jgi:DNA-binding transcriptional regulator YiaG